MGVIVIHGRTRCINGRKAADKRTHSQPGPHNVNEQPYQKGKKFRIDSQYNVILLRSQRGSRIRKSNCGETSAKMKLSSKKNWTNFLQPPHPARQQSCQPRRHWVQDGVASIWAAGYIEGVFKITLRNTGQFGRKVVFHPLLGRLYFIWETGEKTPMVFHTFGLGARSNCFRVGFKKIGRLLFHSPFHTLSGLSQLRKGTTWGPPGWTRPHFKVFTLFQNLNFPPPPTTTSCIHMVWILRLRPSSHNNLLHASKLAAAGSRNGFLQESSLASPQLLAFILSQFRIFPAPSPATS